MKEISDLTNESPLIGAIASVLEEYRTKGLNYELRDNNPKDRKTKKEMTFEVYSRAQLKFAWMKFKPNPSFEELVNNINQKLYTGKDAIFPTSGSMGPYYNDKEKIASYIEMGTQSRSTDIAHIKFFTA